MTQDPYDRRPDQSWYPAPPQGGSPVPPPGYWGGPPPGPRPTNTLAIIALVMAFVFAPVAIVLGIVARRQIRETGEDGDALALAGLIIGSVFTGIIVLFVAVYVIGIIAFLGAVSAGPG